MKLSWGVGIFFLVAGSLGNAAETECPHQIDYASGKPFKVGRYYYYPNGQRILRGGYEGVQYMDGSWLSYGKSSHYPGGEKLQLHHGDNFYPNGQVARQWVDWSRGGYEYYHPDGRVMKDGEKAILERPLTSQGKLTILVTRRSEVRVVAEYPGSSSTIMPGSEEGPGERVSVTALWTDGRYPPDFFLSFRPKEGKSWVSVSEGWNSRGDYCRVYGK